MGLKQAYFALRDRVRFIWAQKKYGYMPGGNVQDFKWENLNHIVILKLDGKLGDTQVMSDFYRRLKALPQRPLLSVVCPENLASVYYDILGFDQVLVSSRKPGAGEINSLCQQIVAASQGAGHQGKVDLVLSTEPAYRPRDFIFNWTLRPDFIAGCDYTVASINLHIFHPATYNHPVSRAFTELLNRGGVDTSDSVRYTPLFKAEHLSRAMSILNPSAVFNEPSDQMPVAELAARARAAAASTPLFGINPMAAPKSRRMSPEVCASIIKDILGRSESTRVLLMCPASSREFIRAVMALMPPVTAALHGTRLLTMPENTSVSDLAALTALLDGMISVDTATVHLACSCNIAQICFYDNAGLESCRWQPLSHNAQCIKFDQALGTLPERALLEPAAAFIDQQLASR